MQRRSIALAGNPNVGKSTVFNALTGLRQHTGNWPGKTVEVMRGLCVYDGVEYALADLPGCWPARRRRKSPATFSALAARRHPSSWRTPPAWSAI